MTKNNKHIYIYINIYIYNIYIYNIIYYTNLFSQYPNKLNSNSSHLAPGDAIRPHPSRARSADSTPTPNELCVWPLGDHNSSFQFCSTSPWNVDTKWILSVLFFRYPVDFLKEVCWSKMLCWFLFILLFLTRFFCAFSDCPSVGLSTCLRSSVSLGKLERQKLSGLDAPVENFSSRNEWSFGKTHGSIQSSIYSRWNRCIIVRSSDCISSTIIFYNLPHSIYSIYLNSIYLWYLMI